MRLIHISQYQQEKMKLAKSVYDVKGRVLLAAGNRIHPMYLERLQSMGITSLIIEDEESKGITLEEMLDMSTWMEAIQTLKDIFDKVASNQPFPISILQASARKLVAEVKQRFAIVLIPSTSLPNELSPYAHAVNVTLISLLVAKRLQYNDLQLHDLAIGCLLHDIGKLNAKEEEHTELGFSILRKVREINLLSAHVAYQHHERMDGTGYPRGIKGTEFLELAQVCAVANLFENLISIENMPPHEAIEMIMTQNGVGYLASIIQAFVRSVPPYTPGMKVVLNNNEPAIVTRIESNIQRPVVRVLSNNQEVSLADDLTIMVSKVL
jgi:putative nucleotidyltransferase with HDIG domain